MATNLELYGWKKYFLATSVRMSLTRCTVYFYKQLHSLRFLIHPVYNTKKLLGNFQPIFHKMRWQFQAEIENRAAYKKTVYWFACGFCEEGFDSGLGSCCDKWTYDAKVPGGEQTWFRWFYDRVFLPLMGQCHVMSVTTNVWLGDRWTGD